MREITELMDHYRTVARSVWNIGFWPVKELQNWDAWDRFEHLKKLIFTGVVIAQLEDIGCGHLVTEAPMVKVQVVPLEGSSVPIMINRPREGDRNTYWDDPVRHVQASDVRLQFLDYFDWNCMAYVDFQYYRVLIESFRAQPELVGREALLEHQYAKVFVPEDRAEPEV